VDSTSSPARRFELLLEPLVVPQQIALARLGGKLDLAADAQTQLHVFDFRERPVGEHRSDVELPSWRDRPARIGGHFERDPGQQISGAHEFILFVAQPEKQVVFDVFIKR
jgi:hypothetical protein